MEAHWSVAKESELMVRRECTDESMVLLQEQAGSSSIKVG